jgi:hypothetical protein
VISVCAFFAFVTSSCWGVSSVGLGGKKISAFGGISKAFCSLNVSHKEVLSSPTRRMFACWSELVRTFDKVYFRHFSPVVTNETLKLELVCHVPVRTCQNSALHPKMDLVKFFATRTISSWFELPKYCCPAKMCCLYIQQTKIKPFWDARQTKSRFELSGHPNFRNFRRAENESIEFEFNVFHTQQTLRGHGIKWLLHSEKCDWVMLHNFSEETAPVTIYRIGFLLAQFWCT